MTFTLQKVGQLCNFGNEAFRFSPFPELSPSCVKVDARIAPSCLQGGTQVAAAAAAAASAAAGAVSELLEELRGRREGLMEGRGGGQGN